MTAGTIFHRTRTPLRVWFAAAWLMTSQKHGVSAVSVQRSLGLGSYQTAWAMLHRYRVAMVRPGRERLAGHVEVDEAYVGGVEGNAQGCRTETKAIVAIAVEIENPKGFGRIRLRHVPDVSAESLLPFIDEAIESGASVHTDGWQAYWTLPDRGYEHERTVMRQQREPAHVVMPGVHRVASLLQRWLLGTHQGRVSREHLDAYLNEYSIDAARDVAAFSSTGCWSSPSLLTRSPTAASSSTRPRPAGDRRSRLGPGASPSFRPSTVPGAKTPQPWASLTQMDNPLRGKKGRHRPRNVTSRAWQCLRSYGFSDRERDENCALAIAWKHALASRARRSRTRSRTPLLLSQKPSVRTCPPLTLGSLVPSPRSKRARAGRGTTALTLAPARAGLSQRHGPSSRGVAAASPGCDSAEIAVVLAIVLDNDRGAERSAPRR